MRQPGHTVPPYSSNIGGKVPPASGELVARFGHVRIVGSPGAELGVRFLAIVGRQTLNVNSSIACVHWKAQDGGTVRVQRQSVGSSIARDKSRARSRKLHRLESRRSELQRSRGRPMHRRSCTCETLIGSWFASVSLTCTAIWERRASDARRRSARSRSIRLRRSGSSRISSRNQTTKSTAAFMRSHTRAARTKRTTIPTQELMNANTLANN